MTSTATAAPATSYQGTDKLLFGLVLAVVTFWLFAGTTGTVAPAIMEDIGPRFIDAASMNLAVSITALFSGLFIVLMGGLADRVGRVKITLIGVALGVVGSLLLVFAVGGLALPLLLIGQYVVLAIIAYCLFGLGLAFYATPSTDAALMNLPAAQVGSGAGIYKMASSLGGAIGAAVSLALFTGLSGSPVTIIGDVVHMDGRTDNIALRLAAMIALGVNLVFVLLAIVIITVMVPKQSGRISP
jgi:MFS family permease